jgi:hypothetical protein
MSKHPQGHLDEMSDPEAQQLWGAVKRQIEAILYHPEAPAVAPEAPMALRPPTPSRPPDCPGGPATAPE